MTNVDQALVDQMAQTITEALAGCDLRTGGAAVYGGNVAAGAVTPLIAAAVDAARAEGYEQGKAAVREAVLRERETLRVGMLSVPLTEERESYADGFASGLSVAIHALDGALALDTT